ncbi:DUF1697 domain-containing protein [Galactobacter valiniphilus]|uniref:DUF1697 domain-containing protein n=1 Tax=Galactobacter valiniphilus TaxID=2676122 RepID=A0A399JA82_9MICC|nr:DUF1697 domain-containing protein [Galactobacter valiniphilus]RII42485.1 DUF1697 domain-containing protein [Galactobacter valiniphilus]
MTEWVALLRGINVGGVNIKSAELAGLFRESGFDAVKTVLATGNVLFSSPEEAGDTVAAEGLRTRLEELLSERFGYEARVVLEPRARIAGVAAAYPYAESAAHHAYVVFGSDPGALAALLDDAAGRGLSVDAPAADREGVRASDALDRGSAGPVPVAEGAERVSAGEGVLYWACPRGSSTDTPFSKLTAAARHKPSLTTRNLNTVRKLL